MNRRTFLAYASTGVVCALAGCANRIGLEEDAEEPRTVTRTQNGIVIRNLEVLSEGSRECYHTYNGWIENTTGEHIEDVSVSISILSEEDRVLSEFTLQYATLSPGETLKFTVNHGPEKNQCWDGHKATDYSIDVTYSG